MIDDRPTRVLSTCSFQGLFKASDDDNESQRTTTTSYPIVNDLCTINDRPIKRRVLIYEWQEYTGGQATISCPSSWPIPGEMWRSLLVTCYSSIWRLSESKDVPVYHCHLEHSLGLLDSDVGCSLTLLNNRCRFLGFSKLSTRFSKPFPPSRLNGHR